MFAVIRHYHFNPKDSAEIDRRVREDFVPFLVGVKQRYDPQDLFQFAQSIPVNSVI